MGSASGAGRPPTGRHSRPVGADDEFALRGGGITKTHCAYAQSVFSFVVTNAGTIPKNQDIRPIFVYISRFSTIFLPSVRGSAQEKFINPPASNPVMSKIDPRRFFVCLIHIIATALFAEICTFNKSILKKVLDYLSITWYNLTGNKPWREVPLTVPSRLYVRICLIPALTLPVSARFSRIRCSQSLY